MTRKTKTAWRTVRLGDVAGVNSSSIVSGYPHKEIQYVDISSVGSDVLLGSQCIALAKAPGRARRIVKSGDTIISTVRPNRRSFLYMNEPAANTVVSTGFAVLSPKKVLDARFLHYLVTRHEFTDYLVANAKGSAYPAVSPEVIADAEIQLPTLQEQRGIADILSAFDEKIENNNRIIKTLEEMAQAIFKEWFVNFRFPGHEKAGFINSSFGRIPKGWEVNKISDVAQLNRGVSYASSEISLEGEGVQMINLANFLRGGGFKTEGTKNYTGKFKSSHTVKPGQVVIAMTDITANREIVGHPARIPESLNGAIISLDVCSLKTDDVCVEFLYFLLLRKSFAQVMASSATGTNVSHLSKKSVEEYEFVLPDHIILEKFNDSIRPMVSQQDILSEENKKLAAMRDLLIPRLMSGALSINT